MTNESNELILKRTVLEAVRKEMPVNRMDTDEEVAMERLYHRIVARIETIPTSEGEIDVDSYMKGVRYAIYEIMKEADVYGSNEIRNSGSSDDEMCAAAAEKLKETISQPVWFDARNKETAPKTRECVLVAAFWHEAWQTLVGWYEPVTGRWNVNTGHGYESDLVVARWMPKPVPPKEELKEEWK